MQSTAYLVTASFVLAVALMLLIERAAYAQDSENHTWVNIKSSDEAYSAIFPGRPKPLEIPRKDLDPLRGLTWEDPNEPRMFAVIWDAYEVNSAERYLDGVEMGHKQRDELVSSRRFTLQERAAAEFFYTTGEGEKKKFWYKTVVIDTKRVYMIQVMSIGQKTDFVEVKRFLSSFRFGGGQ